MTAALGIAAAIGVPLAAGLIVAILASAVPRTRDADPTTDEETE